MGVQLKRMDRSTSGTSWLASLVFGIGLILILAYLRWIRPPDFCPGYSEDYCPDFLRLTMAENLIQFGKPTFHSDHYMAPFGASMPYMSWAIERDWLGAYAWIWNPRFPFNWVHLGVSLLVSYLGVGWILKQMRLRAELSWFLAASVVLFHIPRHFKTWHHMEHLTQHWVYLSVFLDAWIWQRFLKEKRIAAHLEAWRIFLLLGTFCSTGTFWGPMILEWMVVRGCIAGFLLQLNQGQIFPIQKVLKAFKSVKNPLVQWNRKLLFLPILLSAVLVAIELRWFLELREEAKSFGDVLNNGGYFAFFLLPFRPLWWSRLFPHSVPFYELTETTVSLGWFLILPFFLSLILLRKKRGGPGLHTVLPFLLLIGFAYSWQCRILPLFIQDFLKPILPFMRYFRVASRWSLFLPPLLGVVIALSFPQVESWVLKQWRSEKFRIALVVFLVSSLLEATWLVHPAKMMPKLPQSIEAMMNRIHDSPGTTVLDLPFCVAGGNAVCQTRRCPNYPASTLGLCLRVWHTKKLYGLYQARMSEEHCAAYDHSPYSSWFSAWNEGRCFHAAEWKDFCSYLDQRSDLSAILFYPDVWKTSPPGQCLAEFDAHLGGRLGEGEVLATATDGGGGANPTRIVHYAPKCVKAQH